MGAMMVELARLGVLGFGGVAPQAYHVFVERSGWLSADDFAENLSIAQALPGANTVNLCAIVGDRWFGPAGALAAVAAITVPPLAIVLLAASAAAQIEHVPRFMAAQCAVVAASAGLIFATAYRVFSTIARRRALGLIIGVAVTAAVLTHVLSMPTATVLAIAAGVAVDALARPAG